MSTSSNGNKEKPLFSSRLDLPGQVYGQVRPGKEALPLLERNTGLAAAARCLANSSDHTAANRSKQLVSFVVVVVVICVVSSSLTCATVRRRRPGKPTWRAKIGKYCCVVAQVAEIAHCRCQVIPIQVERQVEYIERTVDRQTDDESQSARTLNKQRRQQQQHTFPISLPVHLATNNLAAADWPPGR